MPLLAGLGLLLAGQTASGAGGVGARPDPESRGASRVRLLPDPVYRTSAGFRLIVQGKGFTPGSPETRKLMRRFGADYLYATLCDAQKCFRARLTPKPYRIRHHGRKFIWPRPA